MSNTDFPPLFDGGTFIGYSDDMLASLTPQRRALYESVRDACTAMTRVDAELAAATEHVKECMAAVSEAEKVTQRNRIGFHDLWKEHVRHGRA